MDRQGTREWMHRGRAIATIAQELQAALPAVIDFMNSTIIPVPPSKVKGNPLYDDRLMQILQRCCPVGADVREWISCRADLSASHENEDRATVAELLDNYQWTGPTALLGRSRIVIFDDMITGGNHFVACRQLVRTYHPEAAVIGVFVSRRILAPDDSWKLDFLNIPE